MPIPKSLVPMHLANAFWGTLCNNEHVHIGQDEKKSQGPVALRLIKHSGRMPVSPVLN